MADTKLTIKLRQTTLSKAIAASGVALKNITGIEITAGVFTANDWLFLADNKNKLNSLRSFSITSGVTSVANMPRGNALKSLYFNKNLTSVSIDASISIGSYAFRDCKALTTVNLPAATSIGNYAFNCCTALTTVNLPAATKIGSEAFSGCKALTTVNLPAATNIGSGAFRSCKSLTIVNLPVVNSIGQSAFVHCEAFTTVNLPAATDIGRATFYGCKALTTVNLSEATNIGDYAFWCCRALTTVNLPAATDIGLFAFSCCENLTTVNLPAVTSIGDYAFSGCENLTTVSLPAATSIGKMAFGGCKALTTVNLPTATNILDGAFWCCGALTTVNLPAANSIPRTAFEYCPLTLNVLGATIIYDGTFKNSKALTTINPPAAPDIDEHAFSNCENLTTVNLPAANNDSNDYFEEYKNEDSNRSNLSNDGDCSGRGSCPAVIKFQTELCDALYEILNQPIKGIDEKGKGWIAEGTLINIIMDIMGTNFMRRDKRIMKTFIEDGYGKQALELENKNVSDVDKGNLISRAAQHLIVEGFEQEYVNYVLSCIRYGMGWQTERPIGNSENLGKETAKSVVKHIVDVDGFVFSMIFIDGGDYALGATPEQGLYASFDEKPSVKKSIKDFYLAETPVTQSLWTKIMGDNPSHFKGNNLPVERVSWDDCQEFIMRLNTKTNIKFRLPTEAEWEYAARGGHKSKHFKYAGADDSAMFEYMWFKENSLSQSHEVKTKKSNELGLFDMSGNISEWCDDWYFNSYANSGKGSSVCLMKVYRGGSWNDKAINCRVSKRFSMSPGFMSKEVGLRLAASKI